MTDIIDRTDELKAKFPKLEEYIKLNPILNVIYHIYIQDINMTTDKFAELCIIELFNLNKKLYKQLEEHIKK